MSYYLSTLPSNTTNEHCTISAYTSTATDWEVEFRVINPDTDAFYPIGRVADQASYIRTFPESAKDTARVRLNATNYDFTWASKLAYDGEFHVYKFVSAAGVISAFRDDIEAEQTNSASVAFSGVDALFRASGIYSTGGLSYLKITENGTLVHHWDAPSSNGTGSTLPDIVGTKDATLVNFTTDDSQWVADTTLPPTYTSAPAVTATTETGHTISATLNEAGTIYGVRLSDGAAAPTSAQVKAGQDSTGAAAPEAQSSAAANSASLTFSAGSASTAYDYYIVAEDDETTPNLQASPTLVEATTAAVAAVPGLPAYTLRKDGATLGNLTGVKCLVTATGELNGTERYSASNLTTTSGVLDAIDLSGSGAVIGDTVTVSILTAANEGITFQTTVEDIA